MSDILKRKSAHNFLTYPSNYLRIRSSGIQKTKEKNCELVRLGDVSGKPYIIAVKANSVHPANYTSSVYKF